MKLRAVTCNCFRKERSRPSAGAKFKTDFQAVHETASTSCLMIEESEECEGANGSADEVAVFLQVQMIVICPTQTRECEKVGDVQRLCSSPHGVTGDQVAEQNVMTDQVIPLLLCRAAPISII